MDDFRAAVESVFRQEAGQIIARLIRISGSFDLAEDALQEAFASALVHWQDAGIPRNPAAWITTAAHRKLIDVARRERTRQEKQGSLWYEITSTKSEEKEEEAAVSDSYPDDRLRLVCTCCHPALNQEAQVALTLRTLGGLTTPEIARAFLIPETTLAQRLVRAKSKIRNAGIPLCGSAASSVAGSAAVGPGGDLPGLQRGVRCYNRGHTGSKRARHRRHPTRAHAARPAPQRAGAARSSCAHVAS